MQRRWAMGFAILALGCAEGRGRPPVDGSGIADGGGSADGGPGGDGDGGQDGEPFDCTQWGSAGPRTLRLLTRREYANTIEDLLGVGDPDIARVPVEASIEGYDNNAEAAVVTSRHVDAFMSVAEEVADQAMGLDTATLVGCMPEDPACRRQFAERLGQRAFRRDLRGDEVERLLELFDTPATSGDFYEGAKLVVRSLLMSPNFLYRSELGEPIGEGLYELTGYELATSLSYTFWGTMPDEELLRAARDGELDGDQGVEQQVRRLLSDGRARPQIAEFASQWLGTGALLQLNKDQQIYPRFNDQVRESMHRELERFVEYVVFEGSHTLGELLTADYVFVDDALAGFYGMDNPGSSDPVSMPVSADDSRGGLLAMGAVMAALGHANMSAPVQRGVFVRERLLCEELVPPPPTLGTTPPGLDPTLTTRERFARHSNDPMCSGCHRFIDPIGFSFERYDGVGGYRAEENGKPVDDRGELVDMSSGGETIAYNGPRELARLLASMPETYECAVEQFYTFAHGRSPDTADTCALEDMVATFEANDGDLLELMVDFTQVDSFRQRRR